MGHVGDGTVDVGAFSQVFDPTEVSDEALPGGELTEDHLTMTMDNRSVLVRFTVLSCTDSCIHTF